MVAQSPSTDRRTPSADGRTSSTDRRTEQRRPRGRHTDIVRFSLRNALSLLLEIVIIAALLLVYRESRTLARGHIGEAERNAQWVWHFERVLHLPSEGDLQHLLLRSTSLVHLADQYYIGVHFPVTGLFLAWLWLRHHDRYAKVRNTLALTTFLALLAMVLIPLAPPRLFGGDNLVDTMQVFGPSAYNANTSTGLANQYAAMPSLHIAWATLVGITVVLVSTRRWRWVALAHPIITTFVVVSTANHYWADGAVGLAILGVSAAVVYHRPRWVARPFETGGRAAAPHLGRFGHLPRWRPLRRVTTVDTRVRSCPPAVGPESLRYWTTSNHSPPPGTGRD